MLIEKPRCNFKKCKYCFDGNCFSADKYENCTLTDLHSEIAKLTVDLDNAKTEVAREIFGEIEELITKPNGMWLWQWDLNKLAELKKKYLPGGDGDERQG